MEATILVELQCHKLDPKGQVPSYGLTTHLFESIIRNIDW